MDFEAEPDYERIETILTLLLEKNGLTDSTLKLPTMPFKQGIFPLVQKQLSPATF
jgi:hypothetical protein